MNSPWTEKLEIKKFGSLKENKSTDVLIIGGGLAGLLIAHLLQEVGIDYILVEASRIGMGITKNTTAKISFHHRLIYSELIKNNGYERACHYLDANLRAINEYRALCKKIPCDFEEADSVVYSRRSIKKIEKEMKVLEQLEVKNEFVDSLPLPLGIFGGIKTYGNAQFHPLKFIAGLSKELHIYENTFIKKIKKNSAFTDKNEIKAKKIIVATHFPSFNLHGSYFLKMYQDRSFTVALKGAKPIEGIYIDEDSKGLSFRNYNDLLLIGGGSKRTGSKKGGFKAVTDFIDRYYRDAEKSFFFATEDCMTLDQIPYIGNYSKLTPDLYVATGFNKWGMTSSMISAIILRDMILGKQESWFKTFSPSRSILKPQLLINGGEAVINLLTPTTKRCSHLGCALKWNEEEKSWDCPCHGSRFEKNGKLIDNPAKRGI